LIRDRGLMKWHAALMQPEHIKLLREQEKVDSYDKKPELDEQEYEQLGIVAMESLHYTHPIKITFWQNGFFKVIIGIILQVDFLQKELKVELLNDDKVIILIDSIKSIERV
jgi:hypothetical protein